MPKTPKRTPKLLVHPDPVPQGTNVTFVGTGFPPDSEVLLNTSHFPTPSVITDANGNFTYVYDYQYGVGRAAVSAMIMIRRNWTVVATATFTIV